MSVRQEDGNEKLTAFPIPPQHFNHVEFTVEFRIENTYMTSRLEAMLDHRLFVYKIVLQ
jgi:hypothetical protein